ncbi:DUF1292 domain-containing protein [Anaerorhabdus sp.]|jgi:uncharacterized protein YrzB (UPF0473 family)|uniref:DUF1292 domain-containing protein n=1 Tax=Anaerorhabdus sp. TaxID=1872524 RepID=UPI002FC9306D
MESNKITITEEDGTQKEMDILFTFDDDSREKSYVLFTDPQDPEGEVFACSYTLDGEMIPVDDPEEWSMIEEVFGAFVEEIEDANGENEEA